jgi:hypothetical protein
MAIEHNVENSQYGIAFNNAYFRIDTAMILRWPTPKDSKHFVSLDLYCFATKPLDQNTVPLNVQKLHAPLEEVEAQDGGNFLAKCYAWVMTQPDMAGSVSV